MDAQTQALLKQVAQLQRDMDRMKALQTGPTLGEFYGTHYGLPALRGLWYPGISNEAGNVYDQSGQGRILTYNGNPVIHDLNLLVPYITHDGTGDFFSRADEAGLDVAGNEGYVGGDLRGLSVGGWFNIDVTAGTPALLSKYNATGAQRGYKLDLNGGAVRFQLSSTGADLFPVTGPTPTVSTWFFAVGRFVPSVSVDVYVNGVKTSNTTSIPATCFNNTAAFQVGASDAGVNLITGRWGLAFLCAAALPDTYINYLWRRGRTIFGV